MGEYNHTIDTKGRMVFSKSPGFGWINIALWLYFFAISFITDILGRIDTPMFSETIFFIASMLDTEPIISISILFECKNDSIISFVPLPLSLRINLLFESSAILRLSFLLKILSGEHTNISSSSIKGKVLMFFEWIFPSTIAKSTSKSKIS